ncbi:hypothetical protein [Psychrobacter frigidicola]|uniref:hypothetical protein n=1 Tax=Psychrobacter frigidicola TaxID=45611 RepID=UPI001D11E61A|nr:hypothetical protein [Psychrobacter frigidicola]
MHAVIPYRLLNKFAIVVSIIGIGIALVDSGFTLSTGLQQLFHIFYLFIILLGFVATVGRYLRSKSPLSVNKVAVFDLLTSVAIVILLVVHFTALIKSGLSLPVDGFIAIKIAVFVTFIREISDNNFSLNRAFLNPAQFFISSFLAVVLVGITAYDAKCYQYH